MATLRTLAASAVIMGYPEKPGNDEFIRFSDDRQPKWPPAVGRGGWKAGVAGECQPDARRAGGTGGRNWGAAEPSRWAREAGAAGGRASSATALPPRGGSSSGGRVA